MPSTLDSEPLITLDEAAALIPSRRKNTKSKTISVNTLWRYAQVGYRGVRLETVIDIGGARCTSLAAIERFRRRIAAGDSIAQEATHVN